MRVTLVLPPSTQLNTPYPSISFLARHLRGQGLVARQADLGLELALRLYSEDGLSELFDALEARADDEGLPEPAWEALARAPAIAAAAPAAVRFLQGADPGLAPRLAAPGLLPAGPRLRRADQLLAREPQHFGRMGQTDLARHRATLFLADLADLVASTVDAGYGMARYQHHLAVGPVRFDPIAARLRGRTLLDGWLDALTDALLDGPDGPPEVVGLSLPFPGTLYGALRIGARLRARGVYVVAGGGYVNTELREVDEPRLWESVDALTYDDGEGPLTALLEQLSGDGDRRHRTRTARGLHQHSPPKIPFNPAPWYGDLPLRRYLGVLDGLSPAHRLWSEAHWNKVVLAHGCYWRRCAFCDIGLDYIQRYEPAKIAELVDEMERIADDTGMTGFHLVDEAAPPRLLKELAIELLRRGLRFTFWGNIRFEAAFTPDLCRLLARAGLVMVTGGLEVASDRLLQRMDKGITVEQAAAAAAAFTRAGVKVHAYLMFGFPTQTAAETVDSAEVVRQLFAEGLLHSAFWHRFVLTRHSGVYQHPERYGVQIPEVEPGLFATNDLPHVDPTGDDPAPFEAPLARSLAAWLRGEGLDRPTQAWFGPKAPAPSSAPDRVRRAAAPKPLAARGRLLWLGDGVLEADDALLLLHPGGTTRVKGPPAALAWLASLIDAADPSGEPVDAEAALASFPGDLARWKGWEAARAAGIVVV
jgi:hypothetical protein